MPNTVVCLFPDRDTARRAVDLLGRNASDPSRVTWHEHAPAARNSSSLQADELVTGGFASSFVDLLRGLLETPKAEGEAATYEDMVRTEGTLVSVVVDDAASAAEAERLARDTGARTVSVLEGERADSFRDLFAT